MGDDLMAEEVEIDPFVRGSPFPAAKQLPVKRARLREIANGKSKVESAEVGHHGFVAFARERSTREGVRQRRSTREGVRRREKQGLRVKKGPWARGGAALHDRVRNCRRGRWC